MRATLFRVGPTMNPVGNGDSGDKLVTSASRSLNAPMGFEAGDENFYRYVKNRPTTVTDPSGLLALPMLEGDLSTTVPTVFIPDGPGSAPPSERERTTRVEQWRQGRIDRSITRINNNDGTINLRITAHWFRPGDANQLAHYVSHIRSSISRILSDLTNYSIPNHAPINQMEQRVNRWFGNGRALTNTQVIAVRRVFTAVRDGLDNNDTSFWDDSLDYGGYGYVRWNWTSRNYRAVSLGRDYFDPDTNPGQRIGTLIHELCHLYGGCRGDAGYYDDPASLDPNNAVTYHSRDGAGLTLTPDQQVGNADSFAGFLVQFYS